MASPTAAEASAPTTAGDELIGLAVVRQVDGVGQVFVVEPDGEVRQVTAFAADTSFGGATALAWSPGGSHLAVSLGVPVPVAVAIVDVAGDEPMIVDSASFPDWSPDGSSLAVGMPFDVLGPGASETMPVSVVDVETGDRRDVGFGLFPRWHPDGEGIAVVRTVGQTETDPGESVVVLISLADGSEEVHLRDVSSAAWSPDGSQVAVEPVPATCSGIDCQRIAILDADTLTRTADLPGGSGPRWSPDGTRLAFTLQTEAAAVHAVAELSSGEVLRLGEMSAGGGVAWSPDGEQLAIPIQDPNGPAVTQIVDLASGRIDAEIEGGAPAWRPGG